MVLGLLQRDRVLGDEFLITREVRLRFVERALVTLERSDGLVERRLVRARIDLSQQLALLHVLPFLEGHFGQIAADGLVRHDGDCGGRRDSAKFVQDDRHVAARRLRDRDDLRRGRSRMRPLREFAPDYEPDQDQQRREHEPAQPPSARTVARLLLHNFFYAIGALERAWRRRKQRLRWGGQTLVFSHRHVFNRPSMSHSRASQRPGSIVSIPISVRLRTSKLVPCSRNDEMFHGAHAGFSGQLAPDVAHPGALRAFRYSGFPLPAEPHFAAAIVKQEL